MPRLTHRDYIRMSRDADRLAIIENNYNAFRRISMVLHRWHELECGGDNGHTSYCITRDASGKPFMEYSGQSHANRLVPIADRERGALRRLDSLAKALGLYYYVQGDCRGVALYLSRDEALTDQNYTRGVAVY